MLDYIQLQPSHSQNRSKEDNPPLRSPLSFRVLLIFCYLAFNSFDQIGAETERLLGWEWPQPWHSTCAKTLLLLIQAVAVHRVQLYSLKGPHSDVAG